MKKKHVPEGVFDFLGWCSNVHRFVTKVVITGSDVAVMKRYIMMVPFKSLFLFLYAVESDLFSFPPFCIENELNFLSAISC